MNNEIFTDEYFMKEAIKEAHAAFEEDEIPIGAIITCKQTIIAKAHNLTERLNDVTAHAEIQAFTSAANYLGAKYLNECTLYVTIEPCVMCAGASYWTQIGRIVYGAEDEKRGFSNVKPSVLHPKTSVTSGIMQSECMKLMKDFFMYKRKNEN